MLGALQVSGTFYDKANPRSFIVNELVLTLNFL